MHLPGMSQAMRAVKRKEMRSKASDATMTIDMGPLLDLVVECRTDVRICLGESRSCSLIVYYD